MIPDAGNTLQTYLCRATAPLINDDLIVIITHSSFILSMALDDC